VVLPHPSMPSNAMRRPRTEESYGRPGSAGSLVPFVRLAGVALLAVLTAFFADDFFAPLALLTAFVDLDARLMIDVEGAAARRSASSSAARSALIESGSSPVRSEAFVVPSVTYGP